MDEFFKVLNNNFFDIIISIGYANLIAIGIVLLSYIIEKVTGLKLFIDHYTWVKSENNAETLSIRDTVYYFILNLFVFIYNIYHGKIEFHAVSLVIWLFFTGILTIIFYSLHSKYQKIDPNKSDDDYS